MDTKRLRQRVLDLAIHGKLVPQNPQDEPASELLKRIAAEKERLVKEGKIKKSKKKDNEDIEEVPFEVPQGWVWCRLKNLCSKFSTGPFGSMVHKNDYVQINGTPLINPANIIEGKIESDKIMMVSEEKSNELAKYKLDVNDIILARRGDLSKCAIISDIEKNWLCGTGAFFLHLIYIYPHYFKTFYLSVYLQNILSSKSVGATMDNLNQSILGDVLFPLPPLAEQHRIVSEVEKYFSLIDILEESENNLQQSIQKAKSKILDLAIGGKLIKIEGNYKEVSLNSLAVDSADGPFGSNLKREHYTTNKEVRIIQLSNIGEDGWRDENTKYTTFEHLPNIARSEVHPGDIVIAKMMPAGRAILCPTGDSKYVLSSDAVKFVLKEGIYNKYVLYAINSSHFREQVYDNVQGVTRVRTSLKKLREYTIPIPSLSEQHKIVERIEMLNQQLDNIAEALK